MDTDSLLLVTGASGFLGEHVLQAATRPVAAQWRSREPSQGPGRIPVRADLTDDRALDALFSTCRVAGVLHLAAEARPNVCAQDPERGRAVNLAATRRLAERCADQDIPLVFTSTDLVFDGAHAPYDENAAPCPLSAYGEQKAQAEQAVLTAHPKACVARLSLLYGCLPGRPNYLDSLADQAAKGQASPVFTDEWRTPLWAADAASGLWLLLTKQARGVFHLAGPLRLSRAEFAQALADALPDLPFTLSPCRQADVPMAATRPRDVSLSTARASALGFRPRPPSKAFALLAPVLRARIAAQAETDQPSWRI